MAVRNVATTLLVLAAMAAFPVGPVGAADEGSIDPVTASPPARTAPPADKPAARPPAEAPWTCVALRIQVDKLNPQGGPWDGAIRPTPEPEIRFKESNSGFELPAGQCDDTFTCRARFTPSGDALRLVITDYDSFTQDQLIGAGTCPLETGSCRLGSATITIARC